MMARRQRTELGGSGFDLAVDLFTLRRPGRPFPSDVLLASNSGSTNPSIVEQLTTAGIYRIHVRGGGTTGEYLLETAIDAAPPTATIVPIGPDAQVSPVGQLQMRG
jgi:hypothetical protein